MRTETLAATIFVLTTIGVATGIIAVVRRTAATAADRRREGLIAGGLVCGWLGATLTLAATGVLDDFAVFPPRVVSVVLAGSIAAVMLAGSGLGRRLALGAPLAWLVGFQVFRVGVELCLALLFQAGVIPVQMTFEGRNWDILVGLSALPVAWLAVRGRLSPGWVLAWSVAGLALLLNIIVISALSMPTPLRAFPDGPANTVVATAPYVWLPAFLVPAALGGHLLVLRRLLLSRQRPETGALEVGAP